MKRVPHLLTGFAIALGCAPAAHALTAEQVFAKVSPSVWRVSTYDVDNLPLGQGSAVVVGPEAAVTNCHVLAKARRVALRREKESLEAKLDQWDPQRDLCQLKVPGLRAPAVAVADSNQVVVGQSAYAIGNPQGLDLTMSAGLVSSLRRNAAGELFLIQTSAAISRGSSGGGLFNDEGALVGLTTLAHALGQNLNFAIPANWVRELPARHAKANTPATPAGAITVTNAVPPPAIALPRPAGTGYARIDEIDRLPYATERMRERYREFLTQPLPRAFVVSESGEWYLAAGNATGTPSDRALADCQRQAGARCHLYAVDNLVVFRPETPAR